MSSLDDGRTTDLGADGIYSRQPRTNKKTDDLE